MHSKLMAPSKDPVLIFNIDPDLTSGVQI